MSGRSLGTVCARSGRGLGAVWGATWAQPRLGLQLGRGLDWGLGRGLGRELGRGLGRVFGRGLGRELGRELGWELGALGHAAPTWGTGAHCPDPNPSFFWRGAMPEARGTTINQWHARFQPDPTKRNTACASAQILMAWSNNRGERCDTNTAPGRFYRLELSQVHPNVIPSAHFHRINP